MGRFLDSPSRVSDSGTKTDVRRPASKRGPYAPRSCLVWGADRVLGVGRRWLPASPCSGVRGDGRAVVWIPADPPLVTLHRLTHI